MKILGRGFQKLEHEQNRHTDTHRDRQTDTDRQTQTDRQTDTTERIISRIRASGIKNVN